MIVCIHREVNSLFEDSASSLPSLCIYVAGLLMVLYCIYMYSSTICAFTLTIMTNGIAKGRIKCVSVHVLSLRLRLIYSNRTVIIVLSVIPANYELGWPTAVNHYSDCFTIISGITDDKGYS